MKKKILTLGVLCSLVGTGSVYGQPQVIVGQYANYSAGGHYVFAGKELISRKGDFSAIAMTSGTKAVNLLITGELNYEDDKGGSTSSGLVWLKGKQGLPFTLEIGKQGKISTAGQNSDAIWVTGVEAKCINRGLIEVKKSKYLGGNRWSQYGLVLEGGNTAVNEGKIVVGGTSHSAGVVVGYANGSAPKTEAFVNKGVMELSDGACGIAVEKHGGEPIMVSNEGNILVHGNGYGIETHGKRERVVIFKNSGVVTTEDETAIYMNALKKTGDKLFLQKGTSLKTTGKAARGVQSACADLTVTGTAHIATLGEKAHGIDFSRGNFLLETEDKLSIATEGEAATGLLLGEESKAELKRGGLDITTKGHSAKGIALRKGATLKVVAPLFITTAGDEATGIDVVQGEGSSQEEFHIVTKGDFAPGLAADGRGELGASKFVLQGGVIETFGQNSPALLAKGRKQELGVKGTTLLTKGASPLCQVEEGGVLRLEKIQAASSYPLITTATGGSVFCKDSELVGDIVHGGKGTKSQQEDNALNLTFTNSQLAGRINAQAQGSINLSLDRASVWQVTSSSVLPGWVHNRGVINMVATGPSSYETLLVDDYAGQGGLVLMNTDLASGAQGDKLVIRKGNFSGEGRLRVYDASLGRGEEFTGAQRLLLIEDPTGATTWVGENLDTGGLWDLVPTLERGDALGLENKNWYLSKVAKAPKPIVRTLPPAVKAGTKEVQLKGMDTTLRQHLHTLRTLKGSGGVWTGMSSGKIANSMYEGSSYGLALGLDKKTSDNTYAGIKVTYSKGSNQYAQGRGEVAYISGDLYTTCYHPSGIYTNISLGLGQLHNTVTSFDTQPDTLDYRSWHYNASYELGQKIKLKHNWYVQPESEIALGYLRSGHYHTHNKLSVSKSAERSFLGRLGLAVGKEVDAHEYYFCASGYREFLRGGDITLTKVNKFGITESTKSKGPGPLTWGSLALGAKLRLGRSTKCLLEVNKILGGDLNRKWQVKGGVQFSL